MYKERSILFLIAETPVHPGSGSEVGIVDLPIQRERYTEFPKIESSGLKGCIREAFEGYKVIEGKQSKLTECEGVKKLREKFPSISEFWKVKVKDESGKEIEKIKTDSEGNKLIKFDEAIYLSFGPEAGEAHAGAISITDARILLFPVKSLKGVFAWITCPMVLERFRKDLGLADVNFSNIKDINFSNLINTIPQQSTLLVSGKVVLEEFTFEVKENSSTTKVAEFLADNIFPNDDTYKFWKEKLRKDLVILPNDDFTQFVKTSTEVITRTKIDDATGTVQTGALWTEEYLPQDTVMYSVVMFTQPRVENDDQKGIFKANKPEDEARLVAEFFEKGLPEVIQIGGNQTIGKGFMRTKIYKK